ncbi:MAG: transketolase [Proteobacteria bacterium]|jgi:transketolase|nr:transketolase [Pseudomonadota bacterium]MBT5717900.1 transketolase [Opitutae bacterium]
MNVKKIEDMAKNMRRKILDVSYSCNASAHIGGSLSMVDIMATLYGAVLRYDLKDTNWEDRDRFILSKGHGALGYYSALLESGMISEQKFATFQTNESELTAHPVMNLSLGIESSNGSLGQGLSMAVGLALAAKRKSKKHNVYVLLGNGECNEGSVWEAVMSAAHFNLDNLIAIVDNNGFQNDGDSEGILSAGDIGNKWNSFGWNVCPVDGHDISKLYNVLVGYMVENKPKVVIANTIKGKGVSFMENNNEWHHNRLTEALYKQGLQEMVNG